MYETMDFINAGDIITDSRGKLFKVTKVNRVNYLAVDQDGGAWNIRITPSIKKATPEQAARFKVPETPDLEYGTAVRFKDVKDSNQRGVFVISKIDGGQVNMVRLGGWGRRMYRGVLTHTVEPVAEINNADWS